MNDQLRVDGLVPLNEPFTALGYVLSSGGGESMDPSVLTITGDDAIVDWVLVELRNDIDPSLIEYSMPALVQRDGDVVHLDGVSPVEIPAVADNYSIAVRHRNHLGVMTSVSFYLDPIATLIDFTDPGTPTYGTDPQKQDGLTMVMWSGDCSGDKIIKYTGISNDRDKVLTLIGGLVPTNTVNGYHMEDLNLDGVVKYTGLANDRDIILSAIGGVVPTATRAEQVP